MRARFSFAAFFDETRCDRINILEKITSGCGFGCVAERNRLLFVVVSVVC